MSNISRHSQPQYTSNSIENASDHLDKHIKKDISYTPSERPAIKNIDSKYERVPIYPLQNNETNKITPDN